MIRNQLFEKEERLKSKTLDAQLSRSLQHGLNCSPFEAEAAVKLARETYRSEKILPSVLKPGQMVVSVISELEGAQSRIKDAAFVRVVITLDSPDDFTVRKNLGVDGLRRYRIVRICEETLEQGGLMTVEDLSYRIFNVGERTIVRDLKILRAENIIVPLRSTIRDIGRTITHKEEIVRLWLSGKQYACVARSSHHSIASVRNYIETFKRIVALGADGHTTENIAFLSGASSTLVRTYLSLWEKEKSSAVISRQKEMERPFTAVNTGENNLSGQPEKKGGTKI
jgi:hypothetical protein